MYWCKNSKFLEQSIKIFQQGKSVKELFSNCNSTLINVVLVTINYDTYVCDQHLKVWPFILVII